MEKKSGEHLQAAESNNKLSNIFNKLQTGDMQKCFKLQIFEFWLN